VKPTKVTITKAKFLGEKEAAKLLTLLEDETMQHRTIKLLAQSFELLQEYKKW